VITVGSITDWNSVPHPDDMVSTYSSRGPTLIDGFLKPDLVAPGNRIISLRDPGSTLDSVFGPYPDPEGTGEYTEMSGTTMAAPMVAGTVALMLEGDPELTPATIDARLVGSAEVAPGNTFQRGAGRLSVAGALAEKPVVDSADSPRVLLDGVCCELLVEEIDWGGGWSSVGLWGDLTLWSDGVLWGDVAIWGDGALWSDRVEYGD